MEHFYLILILFFSLFVLVGPLTVFCHEMGHALTAMKYTGDEVVVYIGSYGKKGHWIYTRGKLKIHFRFSFLRRGLCYFDADALSSREMIMVLLGGPIASLMVALPLAFVVFGLDAHGAIKLVVAIFLASAVADLLLNLYPRRGPIYWHEGASVYNDGYQIMQLLGFIKDNREVYRPKARKKLYVKRKPEVFEKMIRKTKTVTARLYRGAIEAHCWSGNYERALELHHLLRKKYRLDAEDVTRLGMIYGMLHFNEEALEAFDEAIAMEPRNLYVLVNRGRFFMNSGQYEYAVYELNKAISLQPNVAYAFSYRGMTKVKMGDLSGGIADIYHALSLEPEQPFALLAMGAYYIEKGERGAALKNLLRAKELDGQLAGIDHLIVRAGQLQEKW